MNFDISRLRRSDQIIGGGAIAFFVVLFLFKWYGGSLSEPVGGVNISSSANGWHTFTASRWIWILTIIVALGLVALEGAHRQLDIPLQRGVLVAGLGALSTLLILYRIVHHPSGGGATSSFGLTHVSYSYGIKIGIWLGLICAAAITYGGYLAMQDEGTSLADVREQASGAFTGLTSPAEDPARATPAAGASSTTGPDRAASGVAPSSTGGAARAPAAAPAAPPPAAPAATRPADPASGADSSREAPGGEPASPAGSGSGSGAPASAEQSPNLPPIPPVAPPPVPDAPGEPPSQP